MRERLTHHTHPSVTPLFSAQTSLIFSAWHLPLFLQITDRVVYWVSSSYTENTIWVALQYHYKPDNLTWVFSHFFRLSDVCQPWSCSLDQGTVLPQWTGCPYRWLETWLLLTNSCRSNKRGLHPHLLWPGEQDHSRHLSVNGWGWCSMTKLKNNNNNNFITLKLQCFTVLIF